MLPCLFCGGDVEHPNHWRTCDGKQGMIEALILEAPEPSHNVRASDPETSYAAAFSNASGRMTQRWRCYLALIAAGRNGLTDEELSKATGIALHSANKRRGELRDKGLVWDSGRRRFTSEHSPAIVWVAVR